MTYPEAVPGHEDEPVGLTGIVRRAGQIALRMNGVATGAPHCYPHYSINALADQARILEEFATAYPLEKWNDLTVADVEPWFAALEAPQGEQ